MQAQKLLWLAVAAGLVLAALLFTLVDERENPAAATLLPPVWVARLDELDAITVRKAGNQTVATLELNEGQWRLQELAGYPADWQRLRAFLAELAQARVLEPKTDKPAYHARLGVEDIALETAGGQHIELTAGDQQLSLIVGNQASQRNGRYVRLADQNRALLVDQQLAVPASAVAWADQNIINIPGTEIARMALRHADGEQLTISKISADDAAFRFHQMPDGQALQNPWSVDALAGMFALLQLEDVMPDSPAHQALPVTLSVELLTFDALVVTLESVGTDQGAWLRFRAQPFEGAADSSETAVTALTAVTAVSDSAQSDLLPEPGIESGIESASEPDLELESAQRLNARVAAINARVSGWLYRVPAGRFDTINKRLSDLLKPLDPTAEKS